MLRATRPVHVALSLCPLWSKLEQETPGKGSINNIPTAITRKPWVEGTFSLNLPAALAGIAAATMPALAQVVTLQQYLP